MSWLVIVKASSGPRYVVSFRPALPVAKLKAGTRVSLDMTTLTIMRILPREVDPTVYKMSLEDPGGATFAGIGGLGEQVRELREVRLNCIHITCMYPNSRLKGHRIAHPQPGTLQTRRHQPTERCPSLRSTWNRQDPPRARRRRHSEH